MVRIPRLPSNRLSAGPSGPGRPAGLRRLAVALPLVGILGYVVFWFTVASTAEKQVLSWIEQQRPQGVEITHGEITTGGFPLRVVIRIAEPSVRAPRGSWSGPALTLTGAPWDWRHINWQAPGRHDIRWRAANGSDRRAMLTAVHLEGWGEAGGGGLPKVEAWLTDGELVLPGGTVAARGVLLQILPPAGDEGDRGAADGLSPGPRLPISLDAKGITLPERMESPLGRSIDRLALEMSLNGPLTPGPWPAPALRWRDAGGVLQINQLGLTHGPLNMSGDGAMAIDRLGQPEGAFTARVTGFAETIDALRKRKIIDPSAADAVQVVLGLLSSGPDNGRVLDVPLTLQDRTVSLGGFKLFRVKPVDWFSP